MPETIFIHPDGGRQPVEAVIGASVIRAAVASDVSEITAECGGAAACTTCHVYEGIDVAVRLAHLPDSA